MASEDRRNSELERLRALKRLQPKSDTFPGSGVVLSDGIEHYCQRFGLITPFRKERMKPANYKLGVGDEYAIGGKIGTLSAAPNENLLRIPPFEVAVIKTRETINMPRFLIGRWNIQVKRAYQGLLWVGGPQVDAGYVGHLFCPIYNLSDREVTLEYDDPFAVIDFVKTTEFHADRSVPYGDVPDRILFEDYNPQDLKSALNTRIVSRIDEYDAKLTESISRMYSRIDELDSRTQGFISVTYTALAIIVAAISVIATSHLERATSIWTVLAFVVATFALLIALGNRQFQ